MSLLTRGATTEAEKHTIGLENSGQLVAALRRVQAMQSSPGLEDRILLSLKRQQNSHASLAGLPAKSLSFVGSGLWALPVIAAALLCIFMGGAFVAREGFKTSSSPERQQLHAVDVRPAQSNPPRIVTFKVPEALTTASARRKPGTLVRAGRHRGRSATTAGLDPR